MTLGLFKKREEPLTGIAKVYHDTISDFNEVINAAKSKINAANERLTKLNELKGKDYCFIVEGLKSLGVSNAWLLSLGVSSAGERSYLKKYDIKNDNESLASLINNINKFLDDEISKANNLIKSGNSKINNYLINGSLVVNADALREGNLNVAFSGLCSFFKIYDEFKSLYDSKVNEAVKLIKENNQLVSSLNKKSVNNPSPESIADRDVEVITKLSNLSLKGLEYLKLITNTLDEKVKYVVLGAIINDHNLSDNTLELEALFKSAGYDGLKGFVEHANKQIRAYVGEHLRGELIKENPVYKLLCPVNDFDKAIARELVHLSRIMDTSSNDNELNHIYNPQFVDKHLNDILKKVLIN